MNQKNFDNQQTLATTNNHDSKVVTYKLEKILDEK